MQSCSVHHCVLLLLTLTFTTAPVADAVFPIQAKLHQPVTLPCAKECPGEAMWTLQRNRDVVFARCDQTSCSSVVKGYEMSHDQYKKEDLSLTITAAEYSMRNTYACECLKLDYAVWRLSIETVFSAVQVKHDGDLILDLTVPEPVEVIYTSSDSADGERICNVTQHSLQCKAEYTHRTSLRYPELTLRDVTHSDRGLYTIRDTENKEDIRVYAVSVTGLSKGVTAGIVLLVLVLVLGIIGAIIYKRREAKKKLRAAEEEWRAAEEECRTAKEECRAAKEEYMKMKTPTEYAYIDPDDIEVENKEQAVDGQMKQLLNLLQYENRIRKDQLSPHTRQMESIEKNKELGSEKEELKEMFEEVEKMIKDLEKRYKENRKYKGRVGSFCSRRRGDLELYRNLCKTIQTESLLSGSGKLMKMMTMMKEVMGNLVILRYSESLESWSFLYTRVDSDLNKIKSLCNQTRDDLKRFKGERGDKANVKLMIDDTEALLSVLEKWCEDKKEEGQKYKPKPGSAEHSENQPAESESESEPLNHNV